MTATSLTALAQEHLRIAHESTSGRSAHTIFGGTGHILRQTLIALIGGQALADHDSPGDATLQVLRGRVRLVDDARSQDGGEGDILVILEAMQMENEILAPRDGVVVGVSVTKGSTVNSGDLLVSLQ